MKKIPAIIVNWNREDVLSARPASLLKKDYEDLKKLAMDNGSEEGSQVLAKKK